MYIYYSSIAILIVCTHTTDENQEVKCKHFFARNLRKWRKKICHMKTPLNDHHEWTLDNYFSLFPQRICTKAIAVIIILVYFVEEKKWFRFNNWVKTFNTPRKNNLRNEKEKNEGEISQQIAFAIHTLPIHIKILRPRCSSTRLGSAQVSGSE